MGLASGLAGWQKWCFGGRRHCAVCPSLPWRHGESRIGDGTCRWFIVKRGIPKTPQGKHKVIKTNKNIYIYIYMLEGSCLEGF